MDKKTIIIAAISTPILIFIVYQIGNVQKREEEKIHQKLENYVDEFFLDSHNWVSKRIEIKKNESAISELAESCDYTGTLIYVAENKFRQRTRWTWKYFYKNERWYSFNVEFKVVK